MHFQAVWIHSARAAFSRSFGKSTKQEVIQITSATGRQALARLRSRLGRAFYESIEGGSTRTHSARQPAPCHNLQPENQLHDP